MPWALRARGRSPCGPVTVKGRSLRARSAPETFGGISVILSEIPSPGAEGKNYRSEQSSNLIKNKEM